MASGNDMRAARESYENFTTLFKWAAIACALTTAFVVFLIA